MKVNALKVESFTDPDPTVLAAAITAWTTANGAQRTFVQIDYVADGTNFTAFLTYTE